MLIMYKHDKYCLIPYEKIFFVVFCLNNVLLLTVLIRKFEKTAYLTLKKKMIPLFKITSEIRNTTYDFWSVTLSKMYSFLLKNL